MKHLLFAIAALAMIAPLFAQSTNTPRVTTTIVLNPPDTGNQNGITVVNGNVGGQYPTFAGSSGTVRLKRNTAVPTTSTVTADNGFKGSITGVERGDTVNISVNSYGTISGTGGDITIGGGCSMSVQNLDAPGGQNMNIHIGTATIQLTPGGSIMVTT